MIAQLLIEASATLEGYQDCRSGGWLFGIDNYAAPGECGSMHGGMIVSSFPTVIWNPYVCPEDAHELVLMLTLSVQWIHEQGKVIGVTVSRQESVSEVISVTRMFDKYKDYTSSYCEAVTEVAGTVGRKLLKEEK